jgi:thiol:disulfide interchange protein
VDDDQARARHDDDEAWQRFMGRRRDFTRRRRRDLGFAWALLLGTLAVGVLVGLLVGRIGGSNKEEAALTRPPRTVTVEETVETTVEETVETTVEQTVPAATPTATAATATAATATATATASAAEEQYVAAEEQYVAGVGETALQAVVLGLMLGIGLALLREQRTM